MTQPRTMYLHIAEELKKMFEADQTALKQNKEQLSSELRNTHTAKMKEIVKDIGWPTISKVGWEGTGHAWLLVQHSDQDLEFQKHCLRLMQTEPEKEVIIQNIAYLEDRILTSEGRPQIYGTQFMQNTEGNWLPKPIEDESNLELRRKKVGLEPFEEYRSHFMEAKRELRNK